MKKSLLNFFLSVIGMIIIMILLDVFTNYKDESILIIGLIIFCFLKISYTLNDLEKQLEER